MSRKKCPEKNEKKAASEGYIRVPNTVTQAQNKTCANVRRPNINDKDNSDLALPRI